MGTSRRKAGLDRCPKTQAGGAILSIFQRKGSMSPLGRLTSDVVRNMRGIFLVKIIDWANDYHSLIIIRIRMTDNKKGGIRLRHLEQQGEDKKRDVSPNTANRKKIFERLSYQRMGER